MRRLFQNSHFRDNVLFLVFSFMAFSTEPALAQENANPYNPINVTQALSTERGNLSPGSPDARYLNKEETCKLVVEMNGWAKESCKEIEYVVFAYQPGIDNIIIEKPNSGGFVKFDDWDSEEAGSEIENIWNELTEGIKQQSEQLGEPITAEKWVVYPTLNKGKSFMYYAFLLNWNGEKVVNIKATLFDRLGYIPFRIVPDSEKLSENELREMVETTLASYIPSKEQAYFNFESGDKIAAAGAIGVLATLVGVKYGKAIGAGFIAIALAFAKKLWFLLFIPLIFLKNRIFGKKAE